jgi:large subunit ribosomal protein L18e
MNLRNKNEPLKALADKLYKEGVKHKASVWRDVAEDLAKPRRIRFEVNLNDIEKYAQPKETIIVPGIVLGNGIIKKHVTIAALRFSGSARQRIEKAGGACLSIEELYEKNPKGRGIRIIG